MTDTSTCPAGSHRLSSLSSGASLSYDDAGNITAKGDLSLTYNFANRLVTASTGGAATVTNTYGASGQRVKKTVDGITTVFHYDRQGNLLAETLDAGLTIQREYVWLEGLPLALASERKIPDVIVDNTDAAFSMAGAWGTASATGQYGSSYAKRGPAVEVPGESVVDDTDSGASFTGTWVASGSCSGLLCPPLLDSVVSSEAPYGSTYFRSGTSGTPIFTWQATLPGAGRYRVYVRWVPLTGAGAATYAVTHAGGTASHPVSQAVSSNGWYALGSYEFGTTTAQITLTPEPGMVAVADAVKVVPIEDTDSNVARWSAIGEDGTYEVYGRWPAVPGASNAAPFSIADAASSTSLAQDQTVATGQWNLFGTYTFDDPATQGISLGAVWDQTVLADAIHFVPVAEYSHRTNLAYFHVDHLGTPQKMTDAAQQIVWDASYEPFGDASITKQAFYDNPLRFPGQYFDAETGLHYNWNRYMDPGIGRFLQSDPSGLDDGVNTYAYAGSNPISWFDPDGFSRRRGGRGQPTTENAVSTAQVHHLVQRIRAYDSSYNYSIVSQSGYRYTQRDVQALREVLQQYEQAGSCSTSRTFSRQDRDDAFGRSGGRCEYCGGEMSPRSGSPNSYEADHRTPYSRGGPSTPENLAPSCRTCNRSKGSRTPEEWSP